VRNPGQVKAEHDKALSLGGRFPKTALRASGHHGI
jgi:hypothetical protein